MQNTKLLIALAGALSVQCLAQTLEKSGPPAPPDAPQVVQTATKKFYQVKFVIQELENDQVINSRSYSLILRGGSDQGLIRAGEKVPYSSSTGTSTQWQMLDIGVYIDCKALEEAADHVSLAIKADISSVVESQRPNTPTASTPIIRNNQWESTVVLPLKQSTILFSSDDPASKRRMQLQATVTPIR